MRAWLYRHSLVGNCFGPITAPADASSRQKNGPGALSAEASTSPKEPPRQLCGSEAVPTSRRWQGRSRPARHNRASPHKPRVPPPRSSSTTQQGRTGDHRAARVQGPKGCGSDGRSRRKGSAVPQALQRLTAQYARSTGRFRFRVQGSSFVSNWSRDLARADTAGNPSKFGYAESATRGHLCTSASSSPLRPV